MYRLLRDRERITGYAHRTMVWISLIVGLLLVVVKSMGPDLSRIPGDLGDARLNNYFLEHAYRWVIGLDEEFWNAPFFYPFPQTITFSDNLLGSAPFYSILRWMGIDRETAFQGWFVFGFILNFIAAVYVLTRLKLNPLAVAAGAYFFTFGLPLLFQELHAQLIYRPSIPIVCYLVWRFIEDPKLFTLAALMFWFVWQFFLGIYMGFFLAMLLIVMMVLLPLFYARSIVDWIRCWPQKIKEAWVRSSLPERSLAIMMILALSFCLLLLLQPYYSASNAYGFSRPWDEISKMLPRWQSYLIADRTLYREFSLKIAPNLQARQEHQLFPGLAVISLVFTGILLRPGSENRKIAWLSLATTVIFVLLTLYFRGFTLYKYLLWMPGINSIRAVTRVMLVLMWPISLFSAYVIDAVLRSQNASSRNLRFVVYAMICLLIIEPAFFTHTSYSKSTAKARLAGLRAQIPASLPQSPILFVATKTDEPWYMTEIDTMLLSQELGWPTMNGYSGNLIPGYKLSTDCSLLSERIRNYMNFSGISDEQFYQDVMSRIVPIGFEGCNALH